MLYAITPLTLAVPAPNVARQQFAEFKATFNKTYTPEEEETRFAAFLGNLAIIDQRNAEEGPDGATHGVTKFCDLTPAEFAATYLTATSGKSASTVSILPELGAGEQASADWTGKYTTKVKDQGQCGSCWAFSATEQIESDAMRELGDSYILSPQQITSCDTRDDGCGGGNTETAYKYVEGSAGMVTESDYPYTAGHGGRHLTCEKGDLTDPVVAVKSFNTIGKSVNGEAGTESAMAKYVGATGPLSICVDAQSWQTYKSGILSKCSTRIDHCVQAVGIDTGAGVWKVRNSWNTNWGEDGFIRLKYGVNACGLTNDATWVTVGKATKAPVEEVLP